MKKLVLSAILGCGLLGNAFAAGDADAGKTKAATCAACHGANGIGIADNYPNLAGQHADYIVRTRCNERCRGRIRTPTHRLCPLLRP